MPHTPAWHGYGWAVAWCLAPVQRWPRPGRQRQTWAWGGERCCSAPARAGALNIKGGRCGRDYLSTAEDAASGVPDDVVIGGAGSGEVATTPLSGVRISCCTRRRTESSSSGVEPEVVKGVCPRVLT